MDILKINHFFGIFVFAESLFICFGITKIPVDPHSLSFYWRDRQEREHKAEVKNAPQDGYLLS